jgi:exopolysaccharide production protein ExoQ
MSFSPTLINFLYIFIPFATALGLGLLIAFVSPNAFLKPQAWIFYPIILFSVATLFGGDGEGSLFKQVAWSCMFVIMFFYSILDKNNKLESPIGLIPITLLILIAYAAISIYWSPFPLISTKRLIQVIGVVFIGVAISRFESKGYLFVDILFGPIIFFVLSGLMISLVLPGYAFDQDHALKAFSYTKNNWGQLSLLASLVALFALLKSKDKYWLKLLLLIVCSASLILSRSTTSITAFIIVSITTFTYMLLKRGGLIGKSLLLFSIVAVLTVATLYIFFTGDSPLDLLFDTFFRVANKEANLTGRDTIWHLMFIEISNHPWFGIGYGGFWVEIGGAAEWVIRSFKVSFRLNSGHSGYIDLINELGYVGLCLFIFVCVEHIKNIYTVIKTKYYLIGLFHLTITISFLALNYAETSILRHTNLWWIIFSISLIVMKNSSKQLKTNNLTIPDNEKSK